MSNEPGPLEAHCNFPRSVGGTPLASVGYESQRNDGWLDLALKQLDRIGELTSGWNSHGADPPPQAILSSTKNLLEQLSRCADISKPHVNPTPTPGVQLDWEEGPRCFEVEMVSANRIEYVFEDRMEHVSEEGIYNNFDSKHRRVLFDQIRRVHTATSSGGAL